MSDPRVAVVALAIHAEHVRRYPEDTTAGPGHPVWTHLAEAALKALSMDENLTYLITYEYTDQFGKTRRERVQLMDYAPIPQWAEMNFAEITPDAWWVEELRTIEFHTPDIDRDAEKAAIRAETAQRRAEGAGR